MTKKAKVSFLIVVWSIVAIQLYVNDRQHERLQQDAVTAFLVVEDEITQETIQGYGKLGDLELSKTKKRKMLEHLAQKLGIKDGYTYSGATGDGYKKMILTKQGKHAVTTLQVISLASSTGKTEQYIAISIAMQDTVQNSIALYEKVQHIYEQIGVQAEVGLEVEAVRNGDQVTTGKNSIPDQLFKQIHARLVDVVEENGICTVYGYTPLEDGYLMLNRKKVNIQVALFYDEEKDQTYVKIGVPIIQSSY